ncbi:uncharacterized protein [Mytilus edulis]|uniref:uncharacterized protein n=1 Tax=Mytilus edulis TaxID=6550 RepID=UPI0039EFA8C1
MEKSSSTVRSVSCDVCQRRSISKPATKWCPHCEDGLCTDCHEHHGASRSTANHHVIQIEDYHHFPSYVASVKHRCDIHKLEHEFYCTSHALPCCVDCTKDVHSSCLELKPLHDVVKDVKSSNHLHEIERNLSDIVDNIVKLTKEREENLSKLEVQKTKHIQTITHMREIINDHLDKIEGTVLEDLSRKHDASKVLIENLIDKLNERKLKANAIQEEISLMKEAASNLQNFIGMRDLEKKVNEEGKTLVILQEDENFYNSDIHLSYSEILSSFTDKVSVFGDVLVQTSPRNLSLILGKRIQSQIVLPKVAGIEQIKLRLQQKIKLKNSKGFDISSCEILDHGKLLFLDWKHERLLACNIDGSESRVVADFTGNGPFDITCITDDKIAVSARTSKMIILTEFPTGKIIKKINVNGECFGIDHKDGKMLVRLVNSGIFLLIDVAGKIISRVRFPGDRLRYLTWYMDKIYCTVTGQNTVICMNMKGSEIWTYRNVQLREPFGIATDTNGFVYVAGRASNNVVLIAPDGRSSRVILSDRDGINKPQALYISKFRRQLLVCDKYDGSSYLFDF